jgi:hypothetical protein
MTARKPINEAVATATAKLKDSQRALTDFRKSLLERGHIPIADVEATFLRAANTSRKHVLDFPVNLLRALREKHPALFTDRKQAISIEETIEGAALEMLSDIAAEHEHVFEAPAPLIINGVPYSTKPTGRPPKHKPEVRP